MRSFKVTEFSAPLTRIDAPTPEPSGAQVLLKVRAAGVCHSDLHIWEGGYQLGHGRGQLSLKDRGVALPLAMGHETVGEVLALGPQAQGVAVGETRLIYPWIGCGVCEVCRAGDENLCLKPRCLGVHCDGGYADHILVPHPRYLLDLAGLDPVTAAPYACSGVTTYSALKKVEFALGEPILIFGAGGLGLMALSLLKAMGGKGAIIVDLDEKKREAAMNAGALTAIDGSAPDAARQIAEKAAGHCGRRSISWAMRRRRSSASIVSRAAASSSWSGFTAAERLGPCRSFRSRRSPSRVAMSATSRRRRSSSTSCVRRK
jgi:alcohol dehydrogenase, propanol-preferring